jgi:hypothetical protein
VKKSLILLPLFLFHFLIVLILLTALDLIYRIGTLPAEQSVAVIRLLPHSIKQVLPAACICALLFTFLRMVKKPGSRLLSLLLLLTTASAVLIFGEIGVGLLPSQKVPPFRPKDTFKEGEFNTYGEGLLYIGEIEGDTLERVVLIRPPESPGGWELQYFPRIEARLEEDSIVIDMAPHSSGNLEFPARNIREGIFRPVTSLSWFLKDYEVLTQDLGSLTEQRGSEFYLLCCSLVFFVLGMNMWMRITRWPLFNFLLVVLIMRGVFFLYASVRLNLADELGKLFEGSILVKNLPSFGLLLFGLLFILIDALFVPYNQLKEEAGF